MKIATLLAGVGERGSLIMMGVGPREYSQVEIKKKKTGMMSFFSWTVTEMK